MGISFLLVAALLPLAVQALILPVNLYSGNAVEAPPPPSRRCKYNADYMRVFSPQSYNGAWFVDSTTFDTPIRIYEQCERNDQRQIDCNMQTGCNNQWQLSINLKAPTQSGIVRFPGYMNQTYGSNTGVYFGAYYDPYQAKKWFTTDSWVMKTDYTTYALVYYCQRDNDQAVADSVFILSRSPSGVGAIKRNQLFQELRNNFGWTDVTQMFTRNNFNCTFV